ncbi:DUF488 domain-containing protein [Mesorhizobium sp. M1312]|uniref:DUF488 domain-containing protein n=1 Tax=Mesorhizobium sp. M1312 TaxID=2957080 RepID=UPI003334AA3C
MKLDIKVKRIYEPPSPGDGQRVLIDRVWPRGVGKEDAALTLWLKNIAPSAELRKWFGHEPTRWMEFQQRYRGELDRNSDAVGQLRAVLDNGRVTLLYAAQDELHNNAVALADYLSLKG